MEAPAQPNTPESSVESVSAENALLREEKLKDRLAWFERQVFGRKSEKRLIDHRQQGNQLAEPTKTAPEPEVKSTVSGYERGKGKKQRSDGYATDCRLRFGDDVPMETIPVVPPELSGPELISMKWWIPKS